MTVEEIIEALGGLSVLELVELKDKLQEQWGVTAAAPMTMGMMAGMAGGAEAAVEEEQYAFTVKLTEIGPEKIQVIKAVRELTSLGLKEAKELVESAPEAKLGEDVTKEEAEKIKTKMTEVGATVTVS